VDDQRRRLTCAGCGRALCRPVLRLDLERGTAPR
jgi:hypothetical protein